MCRKSNSLREFGKFRLDSEKRVLWFGGKPVPLALKEIEMLCVLTEQAGQVVSKEEFLNRVWADSFVEESNLSRHVYVLRKTFRELGSDGLIETVPRRGYRFTAEIREPTAAEAPIHPHSRTGASSGITAKPLLTPVYLWKKIITHGRTAGVAVMLLVAVISIAAFSAYRGTSAREVRGPIRTLVVLPFAVINSSNANEHEGTGLADLLINRLSAIGDLKVRPISAVMGFDGADASHFANGLGVDGVLEGTIYRTGERVRVTARLLRTKDGSAIWTGHFEELNRDEMQLQSEIASQVANALAIDLSSTEMRAIDKLHTTNLDAYRMYINGRYELNKRSLPAVKEAERLFRNAIEIDPNFALAYAGLADRLATSDRSDARNMVDKALELDPDLAEAHATLGFIQMFHEWRWDEAEDSFNRSIALNPGYATAHHWHAQVLAIQGKFVEAKAAMQKALEINPNSHNFLADLGQIYYFNGELDLAEQYCQKALEIYPDFMFAHEYLFSIYMQKGEFDKAINAIIRADQVNNELSNPSSEAKARNRIYFDTIKDAYEKEGIQGYLRLRISTPRDDADIMYLKARSFAPLGESEQALAALEKAFKARVFLMAFVKADPVFAPLRENPRYRAILEDMNLAD